MKAAKEAGFHPFLGPSANASQPYTYNYSKAFPNVKILPALRQVPRIELRANSNVLRVNLGESKRRATAVTYMTPQGDTIDQPADLVILATFAYNNSRLFILSGIGKQYDPRTGEGIVGKNLAYQNMSTIWTYFDVGKNTNPFIGAGGNAVAVDDFNGDHYDHAPLGFVGGSPTWCNQAGNEPISGIPVPDGMPSWGKGWKKAVKDHYTNTVSFDVHGTNMAYRDCYLDLDPDYRDQYGQSLLRFTFDWKDNDIKMIRYVTNEMLSVARAMNPKSIQVVGKNFGDHFDTRPYQTTHLAGGTIMGKDRNSSVLNRYLQSWDVHNLFALGSDDLAGITAYLKSLSPNNDVAPYAYKDEVAKALFNGDAPTRGAQLYVDRCAGCHRTDGEGYVCSRRLPAIRCCRQRTRHPPSTSCSQEARCRQRRRRLPPSLWRPMTGS
jgi:gluconate 2-dehydrogenase alpha chain